MNDTIIVKKEDSIARIVLNRPEELNALTSTMIRGLEAELDKIQDDPGIRAVLLTGAGKTFCAGVDMHETTYNPLNARVFLKRFNQMIKVLEMLPQPSVAMINGAAVAGGLELAMACTFRIAAMEAKMGLPEMKLGLVAAAGTTFRLPRLVGFGKAVELCLIGELIKGDVAAACGLVNWAVPREQLDDKANVLVQRLADQPPVAMSLIKDALYSNATPHFDSANFLEILSASVNHYTQDKKEGLSAFFEKRKPKFQGH